MGQTLSEPITTKETTSIKSSSMVVASSSMQGWRVSMEDAHQHILELSPDDPTASFFGVYDGHGGAKVARYAAIHLHRYIVKRPEYKKGDMTAAIREGFLECDRAMREDADLRDEMAGATAVTVLMRDGQVWCGNAGDSRCIASVQGRAQALSTDHKPNDPAERERIEAAGGFVEFNRVNGNLALSRALGDFLFKMNDGLSQSKQIVTAEPDVVESRLSEDWEFILLACDGIWDVMSNQQVCDFIIKRLALNIQPENICEELMDRCLAPDCQVGGLGCDNMTVVLVCLLHQGQSWSQLVAHCAALQAAKDAAARQEIEDELRLAEEEDARSILNEPGTTNTTTNNTKTSITPNTPNGTTENDGSPAEPGE